MTPSPGASSTLSASQLSGKWFMQSKITSTWFRQSFFHRSTDGITYRAISSFLLYGACVLNEHPISGPDKGLRDTQDQHRGHSWHLLWPRAYGSTWITSYGYSSYLPPFFSFHRMLLISFNFLLKLLKQLILLSWFVDNLDTAITSWNLDLI